MNYPQSVDPWWIRWAQRVLGDEELAVGDFFRTEKGGVPSRITKLESFPNPLKVEKLGQQESLKEAGSA